MKNLSNSTEFHLISTTLVWLLGFSVKLQLGVGFVVGKG